MTTFSRTCAPLLALFAVTFAFAGQAAFSAPHAHAASPYTVTITPAALSYPVGGEAILAVRLEAADVSQLPALNYDVEGGEIVHIDALAPVSSSAAVGAIHVTRNAPGAARVTASFAGNDLATSEARFVAMGAVQLNLALTGAGPDAAARTWRFEVLNSSGVTVATLQAGTNGDELTTSVATSPLPYGIYTVRQVLGSDTRLACANGAFYAVTAPTNAETTIELASASAGVSFTIAVCDGAPQLSFQAPVDPIAPSAANTGLPGDVAPGETPINEVRGARAEGPGSSATPLPPQTGSGVTTESVALSLPLLLGMLLVLFAPAAYAMARISSRHTR